MTKKDYTNLYEAVLSLKDEKACESFFNDICTPKELEDMSDRLHVAELLLSGFTYEKIIEETGMSSTTIARINRTLLYGDGGYKEVLKNKPVKNKWFIGHLFIKIGFFYNLTIYYSTLVKSRSIIKPRRWFFMKKILGLFIILLFITGCSSKAESSVDDSLDKIIEKKAFKIGHTDYPPFGMLDKGVSIGFDIDIAKEVAKRLGVDFQTKYIDWDSKQFELDNGNIDAIWNGFTITKEREKQVTFTKPYFDNHIVMMSLKGNTYTSLDDLKDKVVGV